MNLGSPYKRSARSKIRDFYKYSRIQLELIQCQFSQHKTFNGPDFLCIGAARAGTTWLYENLKHHPRVCLSKRKELHFFDEKPGVIQKCSVLQQNWQQPFYFTPTQVTHLSWYASHYFHCEDQLKGDISPSYCIISRDRVNQVHELLPEAKIIFIIRNPIQRAWSGLRFTWRNYFGTELRGVPQDDLIQAVSHPERLRRGNYREAIENWEAFFKDSQIFYGFYDDLAEDPLRFLEQICHFLGVTIEEIPENKLNQQAVNIAPGETMPPEVFKLLAHQYRSQIKFIEEKFSRNLQHWLEIKD